MNHSIVFIHGSGDNARLWRFQSDYLGSQRAIALDLPGHGQRPDTLPTEVTVQEYAETAYDIITNELHLSQPIIAGHSLGGAIAQMMALEHGKQLSGLILVGTGARLRVHPSLLEDARQASQTTQSSQPIQAPTSSSPSSSPASSRPRISEFAFARTTPPTVIQEMQQDLQGQQSQQGQPVATSMLYRDLAACNIFDVMSRLSEISLPTLIVCGEDDRLTPPKYSEYLHQHITGSTLRLIPNAGHYVMREQPQAFNQAIEQWLSEHNL